MSKPYESYTVVGLDIGGAYIKAVKLSVSSNRININNIIRVYNPIWINGADSLYQKLNEIKLRLNLSSEGKYYTVSTMTAELSDVFETKDVGVKYIINAVEDVFNDSLSNYYVSSDIRLVKANDALTDTLRIAAANWAASAWYLENCLSRAFNLINFVFIDIGSTTTTIIPVINGRVNVRGRTDPEKLIVGELVYTGALRANVATIVDKVPYKGYFARVSFERFALTGDVHLVLGYISSEEYTSETADGRGKSINEAMARLSRVPCADTNMLNSDEIIEIARYIYETQVFKVFEALMQVRSWIASMGFKPSLFDAVIAGIGKHIAREASRRAGFRDIIDIDQMLNVPVSGVFPAYAAALMLIKGELNEEVCP